MIEESDLTQYRVRVLLEIPARVASKELLRRGEKAFPDYEAILADKDATPLEVIAIFGVVGAVKGDRRRFVKYAVRGLRGHDAEARGRARSKGVPGELARNWWKEEDRLVRLAAVRLLEEIGTEKEAPQVYKLVSNSDRLVQHAAIETTGAIGGPIQLTNLDLILLRTTPDRSNADWLAHVKKHRDLLEKRLDALEKAKKRGKAEPSPEPPPAAKGK